MTLPLRESCYLIVSPESEVSIGIPLSNLSSDPLVKRKRIYNCESGKWLLISVGYAELWFYFVVRFTERAQCSFTTDSDKILSRM